MHPDKRYYTGVGSRSTPPDIQIVMGDAAGVLAREGYILRSGSANGADLAFEAGAGGRAVVFLPWKGFNGSRSEHFGVSQAAIDMAREFHPFPGALSPAALRLMARNAYLVLGEDLNTPSRFLLCWTPDGCVNGGQRSRKTGGTGQAIEIAAHYAVPVINLQRAAHLALVQSLISGEIKAGDFEKVLPSL